jgi:hypothetical protein
MNMDIQDLTEEQRVRIKRTLDHFLKNPDYATGDETGYSFESLEFGQALPMEIVLRDWNTKADDGRGSRILNGGDCYDIYKLLYETPR